MCNKTKNIANLGLESLRSVEVRAEWDCSIGVEERPKYGIYASDMLGIGWMILEHKVPDGGQHTYCATGHLDQC